MVPMCSRLQHEIISILVEQKATSNKETLLDGLIE